MSHRPEPDAPEGTAAEGTAAAPLGPRLDHAYELLKSGRNDEALAECQAILEQDDVNATNAARLSQILRALGQTDAADQIRDRVLERLDQELAAHPDRAGLLAEAGLINDYLGREARGEELMRRALALDPSDARPGFNLTHNLLARDDPAAAFDLWDPLIAASDDPGHLLLALAKIFGQFGHRDRAEVFLARAEPLRGDRRKEFEFVAAGIRGQAPRVDQHGMAVEIFDSFASSYDEVLKKLDNNGPRMIAWALQEAGLRPDGSRRVLDAGCGTGLCAGFLRRYASSLAGADISTSMLAVSREKGVYDTLTRTDLSVPATFPEGRFDLVIAADVMVYFGDLRDVLANIVGCIGPGGWFVFTVEKAVPPEPAVGFRLNASGRHEHTESYLAAVLAGCGLGKPKLLQTGAIRKELGRPVQAYVVAAQKPVLFAGR